MKVIFSAFFLVLFFSLLPAGNAIFIDDSMILKNGYFVVNDEKTFISSFEVREFESKPIIRISGITSTAMPFYLIENSQTEITRGFIMYPDETMKFQFKYPYTFDGTSEEDIQKTQTDVNYLVSHHTRVHNGDSFGFSVKTFDKSLYAGNIFDTHYGKLDGVGIQVTVTDKDYKIFEEFTGTTGNGIFEESFIVTDNVWPRGTYLLNLELSYGEKTYHATKEFFVLGDRPKSD